ncbi:hypothetical protein KFL_008650040 [Klebsormidium nitens]|uniref:Uncharacterized protein n=1 Tax=Klebsormidium nitens TaxID=105231 RepID=A0A1Y1IT56_KLENI|nr:hypothetical protein KFL_008650040 [Klebsormidium nitens]|eukprot:GAQ91837.1 hypothetical protein KFL_008650040 [Klebsormidium nitens]
MIPLLNLLTQIHAETLSREFCGHGALPETSSTDSGAVSGGVTEAATKRPRGASWKRFDPSKVDVSNFSPATMASAVVLASSASTFLAAPLASAPSASHRRATACKVTCSSEERRKVAVSIAAAAAVAFLAAGPVVEPAQAKDIPLFGLKKKATKAVDNAVENAKEASGNFFDSFSAPSFSAPSVKVSTPEDKLTKAGAVVVADVVALLVASSVVSGLLKPSS